MDGVLIGGVADASAVIWPRVEVDLELKLSFATANAAKPILMQLSIVGPVSTGIE
jgi:hypothetical protein